MAAVFLCSAAAMVQVDVVELHILNVVAGNAAHDGWQPSHRVVTDDVAQNDAMQLSDRNTFRPPHARSQSHEDRRAADVAHDDVIEYDVFQ
jgi:hypothetical protein